MKKIVLAALILGCSFRVLADDPTVDVKVLTAFNKTFQHAKDVSWTVHTNSFEVKFRQDEITSRVTYDKEGNIIKTYRYYRDEDKLPLMVMAKLKARFADKTLYGVVEESSEAGITYHITLEDEKHWLDVQADPYGTIYINKKLKKA